MKKIVVTTIAVALLAGAVVGPAEAGKKKKPKPRTVEGTYSNPAVGVPGVVGHPAGGGNAEFAVLSTENYISVEIADDSGGAPFITMSQDSNPDNPGWEIFATACGKTEEPIQITPGVTLRVSVYTAPGREHPTCTGPATSGTIKATFTS